MGRVDDVLTAHRRIGLDTAIFIYQIERHPRFGTLAGDALELIARGRVAAMTSVVTLAELLVQPLQVGRADLVRAYQNIILSYPNLTVSEITVATARRAAELRARYGLHLPDAVQIAACGMAGATLFLTNDRRLRRVRELIVVTLDELE